MKYRFGGLLFLFFLSLAVCGYAQEINAPIAFHSKLKNADSLMVDSLLTYAKNNKYMHAEQAYSKALTAFNISKKIHYQKGILEAGTYLGQQMDDWSDYAKALYFYQQGLKTALALNSPKRIMQFYLHIGNLYDDKNDYPEALKWYNSTLEKALEEKDSLFAAYAVGNKAMIMDKTGFTDSAFKFYQQNLEYLSNGVGDGMDSASTFSNLSLNQKRQKKYSRALSYLEKAKPPILQSRDTFSIQIWYNNLGSLMTSMGRMAAAKSALDSSLVLIPIVQSKFINEDLYHNLSQYYEAKKEYASALEWYKKSSAMTDSIRNEQEAKQFSALRIRYEVDKKETLLAKQKIEIKQKNTINLTALAGGILLLTIALLLFLSNKKRKRNNRVLSIKNKKISFQKEKLQEANNVKSRLFSIISHDLRSPLQPLIFYLELLTKGKLSKEAINETAKDLQLHLRHTRIMMDNLLHWASSQMEGWKLHPEKVSLNTAIKEVEDILASDADKKEIVIHNQVPDSLTVSSDREMLKLVIRNILTNAIKFTPRGGHIDISGETKPDNKTCIAVQDNGVGMPREKQKLFKKGEPLQSSPGTFKEAGTGIGLLVSSQLLQKQGGELTIESEEGAGARVCICLPS